MPVRRKLKRRRLIYTLCVLDIAVLAVAVLFLFHDYFAQLLAFLDPDVDREFLKMVFREHGLKDALLLLLLTATTTAIPVFSSSVVCIFNGACFGPVIGFLLNLCGTSLGNLCMWTFFTRYDLPRKPQRFDAFLDEINHYRQKIYGILAGYMMPMFPSFVVNYMSVHLKLEPPTALLSIVVGMVPTSLIYAFGGNAIFEGEFWRALGALVCLAILFLAVFWFRKRRRNRVNGK